MAGAQEKTEKPTAKKTRDAREKGQIAKSKELSGVFVLLAGGVGVYLSSGLIYEHFRQLLTDLWGHGFDLARGGTGVGGSPAGIVSHLFMMIFPSAAAMMLAALGINIMQTKGLLISLKAIEIKLSKLNPLQGFKQLLSLRSLVEVTKAILKVIIVGYVVYGVFRDEQHLFLQMVQQEPSEILGVFGHLSLKMLIRVFVIMLALSMADYYYQTWQHRKDLMMTKQELKEEYKQTDGNPQIKSRIRSLQRALIKQRMMSKVPKADAVIINPTHYAVALQYNQQMEAPKVVAKGVDFTAQRIIKIARKSGVPVVQNPPLARALYKQVKVEGSIPLTLYRAVAKVLAYIYQQKTTRSR